jgi:threonine/homoserine/homoserine lactone efflux protein
LVLSLLLIGLAISLEPIPLTAFILVLASRNGLRKGAAFIAGWLLSLAVVIALTLLVTGNNPPRSDTAPSIAALLVKLVIGLVLVGIGALKWRRIGRPKPPKKTPKWQTGIDNMSPLFAAVLGILVQPWGLIAAGVAVIVEAKLASWQDYLALILFCLVSTASYLSIEIYAWRRPERSQAFLAGMRTWIDTHTDQAIIIVSIGLGLWLIGQSVYLIIG